MSQNQNKYNVIADEAAFRDFIEWLPDCDVDEQFYCCLFTRKKYVSEEKRADHPWIKSDKDQLKRFTSRKEFLYQKVWQCEAPIGAYEYAPGKPVLQEALAIYINTNPRNLFDANWKGVHKLLELIKGQSKTANPHQEIMSVIQQTASKKRTILFDVDSKEVTVKELVDISNGMCDVIETRGGYHVHVRSDLVSQIKDKMWYLAYKKIADVCGDEMSPAVGCWQGGFIPRFVYRHDRHEIG